MQTGCIAFHSTASSNHQIGKHSIGTAQVLAHNGPCLIAKPQKDNVYQIARPDLGNLQAWALPETGRRPLATAEFPFRPFSLLRWFSILGLLSICIISAVLAAILSHFMQREIVDHEVELTRQFVANVVKAQFNRAELGAELTVGQVLDGRANFDKLGVDPQVARNVRNQFYEQLRFLQDVLLTDVIAPDHTIIWSTNRSLVGSREQVDSRLDDAFAEHGDATVRYVGGTPTDAEALFARQPERLYVESYVPLKGAHGGAAAVIKIYQDSPSLAHAIYYGRLLVWTSVAISAALLYLALFWSVRRADAFVRSQRERLVEMEALCVIGEMSAAVAHGIRNPLASIRSSAELSLDGDIESARRNSTNIIVQIDRLGKWVRELLVFSRPLAGENQSIDLLALISESLNFFSTQFDKTGISIDFVQPSSAPPTVVGNFALASQTLAIILSNAIEAMPKGGTLRLEIQTAELPGLLRLDVIDSGCGMSAAEMDLVFKPYYSTKCNGLGLGMSLAKRIMERFGGSILLHSRKGMGTRVSLLFKPV